MKVLLIEDTMTSATLVRHQLSKLGLTSLYAPDGPTGIEAFLREKPDLVLLDVIMPGMDGFEVARRLRQLEQAGEWTPIIFLTARTSDEDLQRGIDVGGDDYLVKPISEGVLGAKIRAMQRIAQMRYSLLVLTRKLDDANQELTRLSGVDGLTGIPNRRRFDDTLVREWKRAARSESEVALLAADVDCFKQYNDSLGHQAGDDCLRAVARCLDAQLRRPTDLVARYGGEEFFAILPETSREGARQVAEGLRQAVEALQLPHGRSTAAPVVTVSIGVAVARASPSLEGGVFALLKAADQALYQAKRGGRNQVALAV
ncbi:MAG: diguanylate cyclase [Zoogloeaceae bacterium]|nr:diguanylate cyclase [Zoogloeaceae bacterium]